MNKAVSIGNSKLGRNPLLPFIYHLRNHIRFGNSGPRYSLQSFARASQKDFRYYRFRGIAVGYKFRLNQPLLFF